MRKILNNSICDAFRSRHRRRCWGLAIPAAVFLTLSLGAPSRGESLSLTLDNFQTISSTTGSFQGQRTTFSRVFRGSSRISTNLCVISNTLCVLHCQKNNQNAAEHSQKSPVAARENGILTSLCSFWVCAGPGVIGKFGVGLKDALATFHRRGIKL